MKSKYSNLMFELSDNFIQELDIYPNYIHDEFLSSDEYSDVSDEDNDEDINYLVE